MFKKILHPTDFSPVAMNAFKHGIFSRKILLGKGRLDETRERFRQFRRWLIGNLKPVGVNEQSLAEDIVINFWMIRRYIGDYQKYFR